MATAIFRGLNMPENCIYHAKTAMEAGGGGADYRQFTTELRIAVSEIENDVAAINKTADSTGERTGMVNELLRNIIVFCNNNPVMDEGSVKQLTGILETTMSALGAFNKNVFDTQGATQKISAAIEKLSSFLNKDNEA